MNPLRRQPDVVYSVFDAEPLDGVQCAEWERAVPGQEHVATPAQPATSGEADAAAASETAARPDSAATLEGTARPQGAARPVAAAGPDVADGAGRAARRLAAPVLLCVVLALVIGLVASAILKGGRTPGGEVASASARDASSAPETAHAGEPVRGAERRRQGRSAAARAVAANPPVSSVHRGRVRADRRRPLAERRLRSNVSDSGAVAPQLAQPQVARSRNVASAQVIYVAPPSLANADLPSESGVLVAARSTPTCACGSAIDEFGFER